MGKTGALNVVTDTDRIAAEELRALLADVSGFWHVPGDDGPLCRALARHRERSELQLLERMGRPAAWSATPERLTVSSIDQGAPGAFENRLRRPRSSAIGR